MSDPFPSEKRYERFLKDIFDWQGPLEQPPCDFCEGVGLHHSWCKYQRRRYRPASCPECGANRKLFSTKLGWMCDLCYQDIIGYSDLNIQQGGSPATFQEKRRRGYDPVFSDIQYQDNPAKCPDCGDIGSDDRIGDECYYCRFKLYMKMKDEYEYTHPNQVSENLIPKYELYEFTPLPMWKHPEACDCTTCRKMCNRPCWPTPGEARKLIELGWGDKLMLDYWKSSSMLPYTEILAPASRGYRGQDAPDSIMLAGRCNLQNRDMLCDIHNVCKPTEGRLASCKETPRELHLQVAMTWNTPEGKQLVKEWKKEYYFPPLFQRNPDLDDPHQWYHSTTHGMVETVKREGLKVNSQDRHHTKFYFDEYYAIPVEGVDKLNPVFLSKKPYDPEGTFYVEIDDPSKLRPDIQTLINWGVDFANLRGVGDVMIWYHYEPHTDPSRAHKRGGGHYPGVPDELKPYVTQSKSGRPWYIPVHDLMTNPEIIRAAIKATNTAVYLESIPASNIRLLDEEENERLWDDMLCNECGEEKEVCDNEEETVYTEYCLKCEGRCPSCGNKPRYRRNNPADEWIEGLRNMEFSDPNEVLEEVDESWEIKHTSKESAPDGLIFVALLKNDRGMVMVVSFRFVYTDRGYRVVDQTHKLIN